MNERAVREYVKNLINRDFFSIDYLYPYPNHTTITVTTHCDNKLELDFSNNIKKVIFNPPATIVYWRDGTKTVVKCGKNDVFDEEKGLAMAIAKKHLGNKGNYNNVFGKWLTKKED